MILSMKFDILKFSTVFFFVVLTFFSCSKSEEAGYFDLSNGEVEMSYKETQCSDPWYELIVSHNERSKETVLKEYFRLKNISYLDLAYDKAKEDEVITCTACTCFTGSVFYVKIKNDNDTIDKLLKIGFEQ